MDRRRLTVGTRVPSFSEIGVPARNNYVDLNQSLDMPSSVQRMGGEQYRAATAYRRSGI